MKKKNPDQNPAWARTPHTIPIIKLIYIWMVEKLPAIYLVVLFIMLLSVKNRQYLSKYDMEKYPNISVIFKWLVIQIVLDIYPAASG